MKVTARQDREPIVDGILSGWKEGTCHLCLFFQGAVLLFFARARESGRFLEIPAAANRKISKGMIAAAEGISGIICLSFKRPAADDPKDKDLFSSRRKDLLKGKKETTAAIQR